MSNRSTESPSLSFSPSLDSTESSKKRRRAPSDCTEFPATRDGKPKVPRRIDPDRLAIRLGPELTSEMDAYIVPGAKMPSFEIRQGFVTKYNVDRRHIYDYFHSRGLRVAKEDKHLNLSKRMSRKPAANKPATSRKPLAARKPPASKVVSSDEVNPVESATVFDLSPFETNSAPPLTVVAKSTKPSVESATVLESSPPEMIPIPIPTVRAKSTNITSKRRIAASRPGPASQIHTSPLLPSLQSMDLSLDYSSRPSLPSPRRVSPLLPSFQSIDLSSDSSDTEDGSSPIFDFTDALTDSSSFGEDLNLLSLEYPISDDKLRQSFGSDFTPFPPPPPDDFLSEFYELQHDIPSPSSPLPFDGLSPTDRMAFYNLVNAGIGPAQGIEESAGTYKAHMERLYCNRSYPAPPPSRQYYDDSCYSTTPEVTHPPTTIEKENINPLLSASHVVDNSQPWNNRYYRQIALPTSPLRRRIPHYTPVSPRREYLPAPSLPASTTHAVKPFGVGNNTSNIAILPATDLMPHERPAPLIWMSPVKYSASASSSQIRTQQWQAQVLARSNPSAISTFYAPSGDRIVYHPKSTL